jgi:hypothetical protein
MAWDVSQSDLDKVRTTWQTSEQSVSALNAQIQNLLIQRGERDDKRNVTLQKFVITRGVLRGAQVGASGGDLRIQLLVTQFGLFKGDLRRPP